MGSKNVQSCIAAHQAFNRRDFDAVLTLLAEDVVYHDHARGITFTGRERFREFLQEWVAAFPDCTVSEAKYLDAGDTIVAEFVGRGVNDGPLDSFAQTGRQLNLPFCEVFRFNAAGRIIQGGVYYDQLTMLTQLGHVQQEGASATA
jgi:steroid delta-isomerase-like uncharacterized protein